MRSIAQRGALRLGRLIVTAFLLVALAVAAGILVPAALGYDRYVITSGSMSPAIEPGALVLEERVPTTSLQVGDVITYEPPAGRGPGGLVTHRIHSTGRDDRGVRTLRTKGDANAKPDPWRFVLDEPVQARVAMDIPYIGYAVAALGDRDVRVLAIGLPALLIALWQIAALWRETGDEARARHAREPEADSP
jgi:signal peptidase